MRSPRAALVSVVALVLAALVAPPASASPESRYAVAAVRATNNARIDHDLRTPAQAKVFDGSAPTLFLHAPGARTPEPARAEFAAVESRQGRLDLDAVLRDLARRGCNEVQVEAGPTLCGALFAAGLVDELLLYVAPVLLGDSARPLLALPPLADMATRWRLHVVDQRAVGSDWRLLLRPR
jgi:diaminohydroxyphosphoribosylaminopyrimidine deaminase/5-amino-6-(5-phosphoribosylamino)uracil reductase